MALLIAFSLVACGVGNKKTVPQPVVAPAISGAVMVPVIASTDLAVGPNRFTFGLVDRQKNAIIMDAQLHLRLFQFEGNSQKAVLKGEVDARVITLEKSYTHVHADGTREIHPAGRFGAYAAGVEFDSPGEWGLEVTGTINGQPLEAVRTIFRVEEKSRSVPLGAPAPRTIQTILSDVKDISDISTALLPNPDMYNLTIADAVNSGKPAVIVFATPGFCTSQLCGPIKELVDELYEKYKGRANFVHVEPYDLEKARNGHGLVVLPFLVQEWGLQTEPWVFMVDREGKVAAKFEGFATLGELEGALIPLLASSGAYQLWVDSRETR